VVAAHVVRLVRASKDKYRRGGAGFIPRLGSAQRHYVRFYNKLVYVFHAKSGLWLTATPSVYIFTDGGLKETLYKFCSRIVKTFKNSSGALEDLNIKILHQFVK
jgi:hypothetical protein